MTNGPRVLTIDIETFPAEAYIWKMFDENIPLARLIKPGGILGVGYKWRHQRTAEWVDLRDNNMPLCVQQLLTDADVVVGFNSKAFDEKHINTMLLLNDLGPPAPFKHVDLYKTVRSKFKFQSGKLDFVAGQMGHGHKWDVGGMDTWVGCMRGDEKSWERMSRYCRRDVRITERVFEDFRPWITPFPRVGLYAEVEGVVCPRCDPGKGRMTRQGFRHTNDYSYPRYFCTTCTGWSTGTKMERRAGGEARAI